MEKNVTFNYIVISMYKNYWNLFHLQFIYSVNKPEKYAERKSMNENTTSGVSTILKGVHI